MNIGQLSLLIFISLQRLIELKYFTYPRVKKGKIKAKVTSDIMFILHIALYLCIFWEIFFRTFNILFFIIGICLYFIGLLLRWWAALSLDKYWSRNLEIRKKHPLIIKGPYRYLRHPGYLAIILEIISTPLIFNAKYTLTFIVPAYIIMILIRYFYEEKEMEKNVKGYSQYQNKVFAFLPFPKR